MWTFVSLRSWLAYSILKRCVAGLGALASDCTEAVLGLTCVIEAVFGRQYKGRFPVYAGRRSSYAHRHRERGLGDRGRGTSVSDGYHRQWTRKASQPNLQHCYGLLQWW